MPPGRLVVYRSYGQYRNRLFQNLHLEAFCLKEEIPYFNPTLKDISKYYSDPAETKLPYTNALSLTAIKRIRNRIHLRCLKEFKNPTHQGPSEIMDSECKSLYVGGWHFRAQNLVEKMRPLFQRKYSLKTEYISNSPLYEKFLTLPKDNVVVGVHIRRGDYKTWNGGRHYYHDSVYIENMKGLEKEISERLEKKTSFIIFSNEDVSHLAASNVYVSNSDWFVDQHVMGKCAYVIGPPSTFPSWASYIGNTKYGQIMAPDHRLSLSDF